jgi:CPA2 family monovalent cation:H+ antiporter-2
MPFRDVFNAVFFVSLGMLVNLGHVASIAGLVLVATLATLAMKSVVAALGVRLAGWPAALSLNAGVGLCTISEFGYVFGGEAARTGLLSNNLFQTVVGVIVGTMMLGTLLLPAAGRVSTAVLRRIHAGPEESPSAEEGPSDHMIVVGYGTHGTNLAQVLRDLDLPYAVIEYDDALATEARRDASHVVVGDATRLSILQRAGLERARALAVTLSDVQAAVRTVAQARNSCPDLFILARVAFLDRLDDLKEAGADLVVPEDYEASIEIIAHAFKHLGVSDHVIEAQVGALRAGRYAMLRGRATDRAAMAEFLRALELSVIETYFLGEGSPVCGRSLADSRLRAATGVTVLAVVRQGEAAPNPTPDYTLLAGDTLVLLGAHAQLARARALLEGMDGEAPKSPPEEDEEIVPSSSVEAQRQPEPQEG